MYDHSLYRERKHFCCYCLQDFSTAIRVNIKDCFVINGKQAIKMPKKVECVKLKNFEKKTKSPFMTYVNFQSILVPEDNGQPNPNESHLSYP